VPSARPGAERLAGPAKYAQTRHYYRLSFASAVCETLLSSVLFRNMTSEEGQGDEAGVAPAAQPGGRGSAGDGEHAPEGPPGDGGDAGAEPLGPAAGMLSPQDPKAIRALAHPVRMALIELLAHTGTLTATQASDVLGESPANCAFHLRTLAKYGYIEEAGGGRGRERPWRRTHVMLGFDTDSDDAEYAAAAQLLEDAIFGRLLQRVQTALGSRHSWPAEWQTRLGQQEIITYLTPDEADQLNRDLLEVLTRHIDRLDHPERRPAGATPVEILTLAYPLMHLPGVPGQQDMPADSTGSEEN
jgi:DNA-binding transcriptional ArsR family regulator